MCSCLRTHFNCARIRQATGFPGGRFFAAQRSTAVKPTKPDDPYCAFRDDRERRNALISRDVRIVVVRAVSAVAAVTGWFVLAQAERLHWLGQMLGFT